MMQFVSVAHNWFLFKLAVAIKCSRFFIGYQLYNFTEKTLWKI